MIFFKTTICIFVNIKDHASNKNLVSKLYNQIKSLVYINQNNKKDHLKVDASTKVEFQLSENFHQLSSEQQLKEITNKLNTFKIVQQIFQDKKYAYSWSGAVLDKLGFQIQKTKMVLWHMSENLPDIIKKRKSIINFDQNLQKNIDTRPLKEDNQKNLNQVLIDPYGSSGTMPRRILYTNLNLKNNGKKDAKSSEYFENSPLTSKGNGVFDWTGDYKESENNVADNLQKITSYSSFIDGDSPSSVILKMFSGELTSDLQKQEVSYPLKTFNTKNHIQTFYKLKDKQKINDMIRLIYTYIQFLKEQLDKKDEEINKIINFMNVLGPPIIKSMFEFIRNNEITEANVREQFNKYNNGSHYMLAVEIFLRGMKNIPSKFSSNYETPPGVKFFISFKKQQRKPYEVVGLANVNNIIAIIFMMYSSNKSYQPKEESKKNNEKDELDKVSIFHFNPQTQDFDKHYNEESYKPINYFIKDLSSFKKPGIEIGHYKL